ncbi:interleukin-20 receptor subunit beta isoform X3 [Mastacembelus armatus]|uniref:interleukin-20 receptor subunit beta isoform X3 n=1 Tax=Mastacembelus armatus TaxID=205130 RepID=UPI000E462F49|nr:interleukin-20 receptor subunit beta isoform X3 [Mastacembelus armatus]
MRTTMMMMMMIVRLDVIYGVWLLPAPSGVSMDSVDMRHMLRWRPLQAPCNTTILYSVQFQGEFELMVLKGRWVDASECQQIPHTHCDLTIDLGSDSNYSLRVRACCGSRLSAWSELTRPFNRRQTVLMVPEMTVTLVGDSLHVTFGELPVSAVVNVTVWRRDGKLQRDVSNITEKTEGGDGSQSSPTSLLFACLLSLLPFYLKPAPLVSRIKTDFLQCFIPVLPVYSCLDSFSQFTRWQQSRRFCTSPPCRKERSTASELRLSWTLSSTATALKITVWPSKVQKPHGSNRPSSL